MTIYVILYLTAVVAANLVVSKFGPAASIYCAFLFIGFDLTLRDKLHDGWQNKHVWAKMLLLIACGSLITVALNWQARNIAIASTAAFVLAGIVDTVFYQLLHKQQKGVRVNTSNVFSSLVDSLVFPSLAFGFPIMWGIVLGQFLSKVLGGLFWYLVLSSMKRIKTWVSDYTVA